MADPLDGIVDNLPARPGAVPSVVSDRAPVANWSPEVLRSIEERRAEREQLLKTGEVRPGLRSRINKAVASVPVVGKPVAATLRGMGYYWSKVQPSIAEYATQKTRSAFANKADDTWERYKAVYDATPGNMGERMDAALTAVKEYRDKRENLFWGEKFLGEVLIDPANVIGWGLAGQGAKAAARIGLPSLAKALKGVDAVDQAYIAATNMPFRWASRAWRAKMPRTIAVQEATQRRVIHAGTLAAFQGKNEVGGFNVLVNEIEGASTTRMVPAAAEVLRNAVQIVRDMDTTGKHAEEFFQELSVLPARQAANKFLNKLADTNEAIFQAYLKARANPGMEMPKGLPPALQEKIQRAWANESARGHAAVAYYRFRSGIASNRQGSLGRALAGFANAWPEAMLASTLYGPLNVAEDTLRTIFGGAGFSLAATTRGMETLAVAYRNALARLPNEMNLSPLAALKGEGGTTGLAALEALESLATDPNIGTVVDQVLGRPVSKVNWLLLRTPWRDVTKWTTAVTNEWSIPFGGKWSQMARRSAFKDKLASTLTEEIGKAARSVDVQNYLAVAASVRGLGLDDRVAGELMERALAGIDDAEALKVTLDGITKESLDSAALVKVISGHPHFDPGIREKLVDAIAAGANPEDLRYLVDELVRKPQLDIVAEQVNAYAEAIGFFADGIVNTPVTTRHQAQVSAEEALRLLSTYSKLPQMVRHIAAERASRHGLTAKQLAKLWSENDEVVAKLLDPAGGTQLAIDRLITHVEELSKRTFGGEAGVVTDLSGEVDAAVEAVRKLKRPNITSGRTWIDRLAKKGLDVEDARAALDDYDSIKRPDYDDAEDYASEKADAWETFVDSLDSVEREVTSDGVPPTAIPELQGLLVSDARKAYGDGLRALWEKDRKLIHEFFDVDYLQLSNDPMARRAFWDKYRTARREVWAGYSGAADERLAAGMETLRALSEQSRIQAVGTDLAGDLARQFKSEDIRAFARSRASESELWDIWEERIAALEKDLADHLVASPVRADQADRVLNWRNSLARAQSAISPESVDALTTAKAKAMSRTVEWYKMEYTNYLDQSVIDTHIRNIFPFWTYASRAPLYLARKGIEKPGLGKVFAPSGTYWDYTDEGFLPFSVGGFAVAPVQGTALGRLRRAFHQPYAKEYSGWYGDVHRMKTLGERFGFWTHPVFAAAVEATGTLTGTPTAVPQGGLNALFAESLPPVWQNVLDAVITGTTAATLRPEERSAAELLKRGDRTEGFNAVRVMLDAFPDRWRHTYGRIYATSKGIKWDSLSSEDKVLWEGKAALMHLVPGFIGTGTYKPDDFRQKDKDIIAGIIKIAKEDGVPWTEELHDAWVTSGHSISDIPLSPLARTRVYDLEAYRLMAQIYERLKPQQVQIIIDANRKASELGRRLRLEASNNAETNWAAREGGYMTGVQWVNAYFDDIGQVSEHYRSLKDVAPDLYLSSAEDRRLFREFQGLPALAYTDADLVLQAYYALTPTVLDGKIDPGRLDEDRLALLAEVRAELGEKVYKDVTDKINANQSPIERRFWDGFRTYMRPIDNADNPAYAEELIAWAVTDRRWGSSMENALRSLASSHAEDLRRLNENRYEAEGTLAARVANIEPRLKMWNQAVSDYRNFLRSQDQRIQRWEHDFRDRPLT